VLDADLALQGLADLQTQTMLDATTANIPQDRLAVSALEMSWYMRHMLLVDTDWASMAQSLEVRVPFLDVPLLRAVAPWMAAHPGLAKPTIAAALAPQLPSTIIHKPKTGFVVPVRDWLIGDLPANQDRGLRGWAQTVYANAFT
jgi:asparagine synthase (glutamine-hydrolysing)